MKKSLNLSLVLVLGMLSGCSIIAASKLPLERPPEGLRPGESRERVDRIYGYPVALGCTVDGQEYVEQLQFVDGVPIGWKIFRICSHVILDDVSIFLWEFIGWPIELLNASYPEYVYFVVYDESNRIVRAIPQDSEEGRKLSELPWISRRLPRQSTNRPQTLLRPSVEQRTRKNRGE